MITEQRIQDLEYSLRSHTHQGFDQSQNLRAKDWEQLRRMSLPVAGGSLIADNIPPRQFLRVVAQHGAKTGNGNNFLRFNNNSGANYTFINSGSAARTSQTEIDLTDGANNSLGYLYVIDIVNLATLVKSVVVHSVARITGAATAQSFLQIFGTWVNTTDAINRIDLIASANNFPADSSLIVFGSKE